MQKSDQAVALQGVDNNIVEAGGGTLNDQELAELNGQLIGARTELADLQAKRLVRDLRGSEIALESVSDVTNSPVILRLREQADRAGQPGIRAAHAVRRTAHAPAARREG